MDEILKHWDVIASIGSALMLFGKVQQQVKGMDERIKKSEAKQEEQDRAINQVKVDVAEIKATTRAIYDRVTKP